MMRHLACALLVAGSASVRAGVDLSPIPPAETAAQAAESFDLRAHAMLEAMAEAPLTPFTFDGAGHFATAALAKLLLGRDVEAVNRVLMDPATRVYAKVGSDFRDLGPLCYRLGDYDFTLRALIPLAYHTRGRPDLITPDARRKLVFELLNQWGNSVRTRLKIWGGLCGVYPETENHILMTETSRYLTNQLRREEGGLSPSYDNEANGMNAWMLRHLRQFLINDFSEYNSRPYQAYAVLPLQNLFEFAEDARVKTAARMTLDYLAARFAASSSGLRRAVPFRRQPQYEGRTDLLRIDHETHRMVLMAGNFQHYAELGTPIRYEDGVGLLVPPALGTYRIDEPLLDLIIRRDKTYFQRFRHMGIELYSGSPSFLISAGGIYLNVFDWASKQLDAWSIPTTLMPAREGIDRSRLIQIAGHQNPRKRINTCVGPGFACGLNPVIPGNIPDSCRERSGNWTFVDFTSAACPLRYGFYAVVYDAPCDTRACRAGGGRFGFFEAVEPAAAGGSFAEFRSRVLSRNGTRPYRSSRVNLYYKSDGTPIEFIPDIHDKNEWGIRSIGYRPTETDTRRWGLAEGDLMHASRDALVTIENAAMGERLVLDYRDPMRPARRWEPVSPTVEPPQAP